MTRNYPAILRRCAELFPRQRGGLTIYDIVHSTVLKILKDEHAASITSNDKFLEYFMYRANTIVYKDVHDNKQRAKAHANYYKEIQEQRKKD